MDPTINPALDELKQAIQKMEARLSRLESYLDLAPVEPPERRTDREIPGSVDEEAEDALEFRIGQYWFARAGIVVLAIGVVFLLTFPYEQFPPYLPSLFGYVLVGGLVLLSHMWRDSFTYVSRYLMGGALLLLFFSTLRLHFFSPERAVPDRILEYGLLCIVVIINIVVSARRRSPYLMGLTLTLGFLTALIGGQPFLVFVTSALLSIVAVYFELRFQWYAMAIYALVLAYLTHIIWWLNNPILGNSLQLLTEPHYSIYFVLVYGLIYAIGCLLRPDHTREDFIAIVNTMLNSVVCYALFLLLTAVSFGESFAVSHFIASGLFLLLAVAFWIHEHSRYSTFFYSILGYTALSVAIIAKTDPPELFIWLSWQSVVVITTAIWFHSRFIIVANFVIYIIIFIAYLVVAGTVSFVSLSFGVVALLSARLLNWQQERLELKTDKMRVAYLAAAFVFFPYALYHFVPRDYVSISWIGIAIFYYIMSIVLKNRKYRWMALFTLLGTVAYVVVVGIIQLEPTYRIVSFFALGIVLLVVSVLYTRLKGKKAEEKGDG